MNFFPNSSPHFSGQSKHNSLLLDILKNHTQQTQPMDGIMIETDLAGSLFFSVFLSFKDYYQTN